jgi:hypothetical protein
MIIGLCRIVAAVVLVAGLAGCGDGTTGTGSGPAVPPIPNVGQGEAPAVEAAMPADQSEGFPAELVGIWSHESGIIEFGPTGAFRMGRFTGTAFVRGSTMVLQVDGQDPMTLGWSLRAGVLELGNMVYLRDDRGPGTPTIVGYWIKTDGFASLRFTADGSFELVDEANTTTTGIYELHGNQLVLASGTRPPAAYLVTLADGLTVADVNGVPLAHYTRAG